MTHRIATSLIALATFTAAAAWNDPHAAGAREHPLLKFYPQASVMEYSSKDFDAKEVVTGYNRGAEEPVVKSTLEGRVTTYDYAHKPNTSGLEIVRQYEGALRKAGFQTLLAGKGSAYPGVPDIGEEDAIGVFRLDRGGKTVAVVQVTAGYNGGPESPESHVVIVEPRAMEQKLEANADAWYETLSASGRVAVYGINFDTGKATLREDSERILAEIRRLAIAHPELKLVIEGHTDNVGNAAANRKLSEERAANVKSWLVAKGVDSSRLAAAGYGDTKPIADNGTDQGRARNRRVELVKR